MLPAMAEQPDRSRSAGAGEVDHGARILRVGFGEPERQPNSKCARPVRNEDGDALVEPKLAGADQCATSALQAAVRLERNGTVAADEHDGNGRWVRGKSRTDVHGSPASRG